MRITPDILLKLAQDTAEKRAKSDRQILAVYLSGSLVAKTRTAPADPLLGGTADIDLFFIHNADVPESREVVRMTDEVHLDIAHHPRSLYRQTRELRLHPWLGPTINHAKILYDPQHFLDFTQASVRGQFDQAENVMARAQVQAEAARQVWFAFQMNPGNLGPEEISTYLGAVERAANSIASLNGLPLTQRRMMAEFQGRAQQAGVPGLYHGMAGLIGAPHVSAEQIRSWLQTWSEAINALDPQTAPVGLHHARLPYYQRAIEALLESQHPHDALWPMLTTWTEAVCALPAGAAARAGWTAALDQLELSGGKFEERVAALDAYLDTVEETLEAWGVQRGIS